MFRKIVSNLAFSPALVNQLGFYAKRLRKEELTRRMGLIFTALALVMQSFAVFTPPEAANAASSRDFIYGGVSSLDQFLRAYDKNQGNIKDIFTGYAGITRAEIAATKLTTWQVGDTQSWGRKAVVSTAQGEVKHTIRDTKGNAITSVYSHPQKIFFKKSTSRDYGWVGYSKSIGWFAISKACANLVTKKLPTPPPTPNAICSNLVVTPISRTKFTLAASSSAKNGATISTYTYVVKNDKNATVKTVTNRSSASTNRTDVELTSDGTYTASVTVATSTGDKTSANCRKNIVVNPTPPKDISVCDTTAKKIVTIKETEFNDKKHSRTLSDCDTPLPVYVCQSLTIKQVSRDRFTFATDYSVKNATFEKVTYTVKDASGKQLYSGTDAAYTQAKAGTYFVAATVTVTANGKQVTATSADCNGSFTVTPEVEKVCILANKKVATIDIATFNPTLHSRNLKDCETVVTPPCPVNPDILSNNEECQPCPGDESLWVKDDACAAQIIRTKSAFNRTAGKNATEIAAKAGQTIEYSLTVRNDGKQEASVDLVDELRDVLEYATLINPGAGTYNKEAQTLNWEVTSLAPGTERTFTYSVQMKDKIDALGTGVSDRYSYDCRIVNTFGNSITVDVDCPPSKVVEQVVTELPTTGPGINMALGAIVSTIIVYFYARSRQLSKEVRLIRRDLNNGTI